jgi:large subunit ribosomal protein L6
MIKLDINFNTKVNFCLINNKRFLVVSKKNNFYYYLINSFLILKKTKNHFEVEGTHQILKLFSNWFIITQKSAQKILLIRGLGFKATLLNNDTIINFKLGYSHLIDIPVPNYISSIVIKKKKLILTSDSLCHLGNFLFQLKQLKKPNAYKNKGIWFSKEKTILKIMKKK